VPSENADVEELRDWKVDSGDIRADPGIAREILEFIEKHRVLSVVMTDGIIGALTKRQSTTKANGVRFGSFGTEEIALQGRRSINFCGKATSQRRDWHAVARWHGRSSFNTRHIW
jgi:hypothetical protein